jgi:hypothetical protein
VVEFHGSQLLNVNVLETGVALPVDILDGELMAGGTTHSNMVPLPFTAHGKTQLNLLFKTAEGLDLLGTGVELTAVGPARYVEDLPEDLWPGR